MIGRCEADGCDKSHRNPKFCSEKCANRARQQRRRERQGVEVVSLTVTIERSTYYNGQEQGYTGPRRRRPIYHEGAKPYTGESMPKEPPDPDEQREKIRMTWHLHRPRRLRKGHVRFDPLEIDEKIAIGPSSLVADRDSDGMV